LSTWRREEIFKLKVYQVINLPKYEYEFEMVGEYAITPKLWTDIGNKFQLPYLQVSDDLKNMAFYIEHTEDKVTYYAKNEITVIQTSATFCEPL
jgi:hypothetical protein